MPQSRYLPALWTKCTTRQRFGAALIASAGLFWLSGCSVNEFGLVSRDRMEVSGAIVHSLKAYGLHLDTLDDAPSLSFGLYQAHHVLPQPCPGSSIEKLRSDNQLFGLAKPQLSFTRLFGMQVKAGTSEVSMTMGARERLVAVSAHETEPMFRSIRFDPQQLHDTVLETRSHSDCGNTGAIE